MALTQITNVVVPSVFTPYVQLLTAQKSAFVRSGIIEMNPLFDDLLVGGGRTFNLPYWQDLDDTESNVSGDTEADEIAGGTADSTPGNIVANDEISIRHSRNRSWASADLAGALAGSDPQEAIASRVADYWVRQQQLMLVNSVRGVIADNEANDSGDMVNDIALGIAGTPTEANLFSPEEFLDTAQTMGDFSDSLVAVAVHSVVYTRMQKLNLIDFIPDSEGRVTIPTYLGRRVIVDDGLPALTVSGNVEYSTYLFGAGAFALGVGTPKVPTAVHREELAGNGGGEEILTNRAELILHPRGFEWLSGSMAGQSPTNTELRAAANWSRVFPERKLVRIAELRTNG
jgi:hypothetical protein